MTQLVLGIDIGTSSSKGVLARPDGTIVGVAERGHPTLPAAARLGRARCRGDLVGRLLALCRELVGRANEAGGQIEARLRQRHRAVPAGRRRQRSRSDRPSCTASTAARRREIAELTEPLRRRRASWRRGGTLLSSQAVGPKLAWLAGTSRRSGRAPVSLLMANIVRRRAADRRVRAGPPLGQPVRSPLRHRDATAGTDDGLPRSRPGLALPRLRLAGRGGRPGHAPRLPPRPAWPGTPVAAGSIDAWVEALSVDVREPGDVMLMYGTTMMVVAVVERAQPYPGLWGTTGSSPAPAPSAAGWQRLAR